LPSAAEMWADIQHKRDKNFQRFLQTQRHTLDTDYVSFMLELAQLIGNYPDICMYYWYYW